MAAAASAIVTAASVGARGRCALTPEGIPASEAAPTTKSAPAHITIIGKAAALARKASLCAIAAGSGKTAVAGTRIAASHGTTAGNAPVARDATAVTRTAIARGTGEPAARLRNAAAVV